MKKSPFPHGSRPITLLLGVVAMLALALGIASPASALPPGGAQPNTPGTSSTVSPSTLESGGTLHFTLRGFPAGEVVSVKIDEGNASSGDQSVQGQGVVHTQRIPGSGTVSGSFVLPSLSQGQHTLRFLASQQVPGKGTKGFTNKSPAFTVSRAPASSTGTGGGSGGEQGSTGAGSRNITNERTVTLQRPEEAQQGVPTQGSDATGADATAPTGGVPASQAAVTAPKSAPAVTIQPSIDPAQAREQEEARKAEAAEGSKQAAAASATARHLANAEESVKALKADRAAHRNGFPWIGTLALVVVVLALLVATWFVARRTRRGTHEA